MIVYANGSRKTGTHLLHRCLSLFDGVLAVHQHIPFGAVVTHSHVHIVRNPRNVLLSWSREKNIALSSCMDDVVASMTAFEGWLTDPDVHTVRFEELLTDEAIIAGIGVFIGKAVAVDHNKRMWGGTKTFTGDLSDWTSVWTSQLDSAWGAYGGHVLESNYGYDPANETWMRPVP